MNLRNLVSPLRSRTENQQIKSPNLPCPHRSVKYFRFGKPARRVHHVRAFPHLAGPWGVSLGVRRTRNHSPLLAQSDARLRPALPERAP